MQVLLFAVLAIELKRRAPNAHTFLEVILARYGTGAHIVYLVFSFVTNIVSNGRRIRNSLFTFPISLIDCYCNVTAGW